jgi:hypothetical protein
VSPQFDGVELIQWAEMYGHPEEWVKRAQAAHMRAERCIELMLQCADKLEEAGNEEPRAVAKRLREVALSTTGSGEFKDDDR